MVSVVVADDGAGFDPAVLTERAASGHIGLATRTLRVNDLRVNDLGGTVRIGPREPSGTTTTIALPRAPGGIAPCSP